MEEGEDDPCHGGYKRTHTRPDRSKLDPQNVEVPLLWKFSDDPSPWRCDDAPVLPSQLSLCELSCCSLVTGEKFPMMGNVNCRSLGNFCSNEAEDVPHKTTISIKKRDCFCSHIRVHPLPVPEEAHPKGLMQEFPRTNAEEVPITLPEGEATVTVHSIYSRIGILLRTTLADYEGSINVLMDEVSSDMGDRDTTWTSHSFCLESIANSSSEEEDSAATQTSLMPSKGRQLQGWQGFRRKEQRGAYGPGHAGFCSSFQFPRSTPSPDLGLKAREAGLQSPEEQMHMWCPITRALSLCSPPLIPDGPSWILQLRDSTEQHRDLPLSAQSFTPCPLWPRLPVQGLRNILRYWHFPRVDPSLT
ncbi:uncharacterized protein LOC109492746 [Felis catus]|uniref:uncharacterized protein LOC109492746 n=1 Tax=Felis catus TaxID=9685 RepID=UPI001D19D206|nr:uncharacterized protein LOC109492746 [Felis catus]